MGDDNKTSAEEANPARRGTPDFAGYSLEQLVQLRDTLSREAAPTAWDALLAELQRRDGLPSATPALLEASGRFSRRDGLAGWLEARLRGNSLHGAGFLRVGPQSVEIGGRQRTWLGMSAEHVLEVPNDRLRNVLALGSTLHFEIRRPGWFPRRLAFSLNEATSAAALAARLPEGRTRAFEASGPGLVQFEQALRTRCPVTWVTALLVLLNIATFVALAIAARTLVGLSFSPALFSFANVPSLVIGGDWWRLVSAMFIHAGLVHLLLNMWALWNVGKLTERLYGSGRFAAIYLLAGICGWLASIAWDPTRWSVGASGAIFGLFGAFLACLAHRSAGVPRAVMRAHWLPTLLFVGFNLLSGAFQPGTDNAAHVGGLLAGAALGIALMPLSGASRGSAILVGRLAALALLLLIAVLGLWSSGSIHRPPSVHDRFIAQNSWYLEGETRTGLAWQRAASQSAAGLSSPAQLGEAFEKDIAPFWNEAVPKLEKLAATKQGEDRAYMEAIAGFARLRRDLANGVVQEASNGKSGDGRSAEEIVQLMQNAAARVQRLAMLSDAAIGSAGLRQLDVVVRLRSGLRRGNQRCVKSPYLSDLQPAATDSRTDGPVLRAEAACLAQELFVDGRFRDLEERLRKSLANLDDLPDGSSTFSALDSGLARLLQYGTDEIAANLSRIAAWRRQEPGSIFAAQLEAEAFQAWAWQARGHAYAKEINAQAWQTYRYRAEMALASLEANAPDRKSNPLWHPARMAVANDVSASDESIREILAEGKAMHPDFHGLDYAQLRLLMPRWGGSFKEVMAYIDSVADSASQDEQDERYTDLVWAYADLEDEQNNVFIDAGASWDRFLRGLQGRIAKHPQSDYLLNILARFACEADAPATYRKARKTIEGRASATAWPLHATRAGCDSKIP